MLSVMDTAYDSVARYKQGLALLLFMGVWALYAATTAPGTIFGDPSEYQFIPAVWGIAHPPGYAFYTLLAGVWQRLVPVGTVAFRTNLLAGAAGAWTVTRVFLMVWDVAALERARAKSAVALAALVAALALAAASDVWTHSIHANAHIVSVALTMTQLWLLVRWRVTEADGWLFALAFACGVGVTHHPITVWGLPAYALFIVLRRPRIVLTPKTWLPFVACGLLGLWPWLYLVLRSPHVPFGPTDMNTWEGFLRHATAQGLRVNLFHFGLADQADRLRVFWTLLRLQYAWPLLAVMVGGAVALARRHPRVAALWGLFLLGHVGFTINTVQDVMAYLLHPFAALALPLGWGALALLDVVGQQRRASRWALRFAVAGLLLLPLATMAVTFPRISLRAWDDADAYVARLAARFDGTGAGAALASDWEHLTPYFYHTYVEGLTLDPADVRPLYVTGAFSWLDSVFGYLPQGPVYLTNYRRDVRELGFRLRPEGDLWRVLEPPALEPVQPEYPLDAVADGRLELLGYDAPIRAVPQGGVLPLVLYARVPVTTPDILMPYARLGEIEQRWTTDSRRLTFEWTPGEIIAERYEVFVPYTLEPGRYPLRLGIADLTAGEAALPFDNGETLLDWGEIEVSANPAAARQARVLENALTNVGNDLALLDARARVGLISRRAGWEQPLAVAPGQALHLTLTWRALARPRTSYTVFVHLSDAGTGAPVLGRDITPLGGSFPTYLWFPKWIEGQQVHDPMRLVIPPETPPGEYWLQVGAYEMGSVRRIPQMDFAGTMIGDRWILGPVIVRP